VAWLASAQNLVLPLSCDKNAFNKSIMQLSLVHWNKGSFKHAFYLFTARLLPFRRCFIRTRDMHMSQQQGHGNVE
jgi:hypothetical protein